MNSIFGKLLAFVSIAGVTPLMGDIAFVTNYGDPGIIYSFDTNNVSTPATSQATAPAVLPDNIAFSPDGNTVYFTTAYSGDVYSFPTDNPSVITQLNTSIPNPMGIAISSDGTLGFVAEDNGGGSPGIYSFPTGGASPHTATLLTAIGTVIPEPIFIVILGENAFIGDFINGNVYSVTFTSTTYNATLIPSLSFGSGNVGGLAISNDGYLYISGGFASQVYRIPLNNLAGTPTLIANPETNTDGLAVSNDGTTVFFTYVFNGTNGIYSFPTNQGFPATVTALSTLAIPQAIDIAIRPLPLAPSPPSNLIGSQKKNDFGLIFERYNILTWLPSPSNGVVGYNIYRNGTKIASVGPLELSYKDHNIKKGASNLYSVTAFNSNGIESTPISVVIN